MAPKDPINVTPTGFRAKVDKEVSSMSIDKEPKAQVSVGKFDDF